jgi:hypothetical protein
MEVSPFSEANDFLMSHGLKPVPWGELAVSD